MHNFEWGQGYTRRFGLFAVDRTTLNRIPRDSAFWFREVVTANGVDDGARQHS
jgi:beta-glucosidase